MATRANATANAPASSQLRQAWQHRRRPDWPATFEACMAVPLYAALLRAYAKAPPKSKPQTAKPTTQPATPTPRWLPACLRPGAFDPRRAAANDLEDDTA